ncbi:MAG TPA: nitrogen fixation protein NifZ [Campylobacterales bacterium]|nr:nitrogen fixation protein NifZ [Campylobacterales bacterium]HHS92475.1 nitrogen fixation protein NifZ [Campylobacterales bacterium]
MKEEVVDVDPNIVLHDNVTGPRSGKDADEAKFHVGQKVKLLEDIVNDGTYPHSPIGTLMMPKGSIGYIKTMGDFLQVIRVYEVHFFGTEMPIDAVGCREHELEAMEEYVDEVAEEFAIMKAHRERMQKAREEKKDT